MARFSPNYRDLLAVGGVGGQGEAAGGAGGDGFVIAVEVYAMDIQTLMSLAKQFRGQVSSEFCQKYRHDDECPVSLNLLTDFGSKGNHSESTCLSGIEYMEVPHAQFP
jgi:hypothetical protein